MCYGLAVCVNGAGTVLCKGVSSHEETKDGTDGDNYLDFEVILPDYLKPVWDPGDGRCKEIYRSKGLLTKDDKPKKYLLDAVKKWLKANELQVLKWFVTGKLNQRQTVEGNIYQSNQTVKGDINQSRQTVEGNINQYSQTVKRDINQYSQTVKGDINQSNQTVEGQIYIKGMTQGNSSAQEWLDKYYATEQDEYTLGGFICWLAQQKKEG